MRKPLAVALFAFIVASGFAQEASNPKPAPAKNSGAFVAIFCSFVGAGLCIFAALQASRANNQKANSDSESKAE